MYEKGHSGCVVVTRHDTQHTERNSKIRVQSNSKLHTVHTVQQGWSNTSVAN